MESTYRINTNCYADLVQIDPVIIIQVYNTQRALRCLKRENQKRSLRDLANEVSISVNTLQKALKGEKLSNAAYDKIETWAFTRYINY